MWKTVCIDSSLRLNCAGRAGVSASLFRCLNFSLVSNKMLHLIETCSLFELSVTADCLLFLKRKRWLKYKGALVLEPHVDKKEKGVLIVHRRTLNRQRLGRAQTCKGWFSFVFKSPLSDGNSEQGRVTKNLPVKILSHETFFCIMID